MGEDGFGDVEGALIDVEFEELGVGLEGGGEVGEEVAQAEGGVGVFGVEGGEEEGGHCIYSIAGMKKKFTTESMENTKSTEEIRLRSCAPATPACN